MRRYILLLLCGMAISGCDRQNSMITSVEAPQSTQPPAAKPSSKNLRQSSVRFKEFSPDNEFFVLGFWHGGGDYRGSLEIWNVRQCRKISKIQFDAPVKTAVFLPRKNALIVSAGKTYLCELTAGRIQKKVVSTHAAKVMALKPDGTSVALSTNNNEVEIRDTKTWKVQNRIKMPPPRGAFVSVMGFSPSGRRLLIGLQDVYKGIELYDVASARKIWTTDGDQESAVAWSPDGRRVAVNMAAGVFLFQARDGKMIRKFSSDWDSSVWFSANDRQLFLTNNGTLVTYDVPSGKITDKIGINNLSSCVVSRDAQLLAQVTQNGTQVQFRPVNRTT